jgi:hypothetical protein
VGRASRLRREQCWQWLFQAEAASLRFGSGYEDVPTFLGGGEVIERACQGGSMDELGPRMTA